MKYLFFFVIVISVLWSCALFSPYREISLDLPSEYRHLGHHAYAFRIIKIHPHSGHRQEWQISSNESLTFTIEKEGDSYFLLYPLIEDESFQPFPAGCIVDPQQDRLYQFEWHMGLVVSLAQRSGFPPDFNFQRMGEMVKNRLLEESWHMDESKLLHKIQNGGFSSRYLVVIEEDYHRIFLPEGFWICEDPYWNARFIKDSEPLRLHLSPQEGLRFLEVDRGILIEFYHSSDRGLLHFIRYL